MALEYLSDDEFAEIYGEADIAGKAERKARRRKRRAKRSTKKTARKSKRSSRRSERKAGTRPKRVARIALGPARAAFNTLVRLNVLKLATKLARGYHKPGGKKKLQRWWLKFGGNWKDLAKLISKGSKQRISNDEIGALGAAAAIAAATPIIIALLPIIKALGAEGDKGEQSLLTKGIRAGKRLLSKSSRFSKGIANMPEGEEVAVVQRPSDKLQDLDDEYDDKRAAMGFFSLAGLLWKLPFVLMTISTGNMIIDTIIAAVSTYCIIGLVLYPFRKTRAAAWYFKPFKLAGYELNSKTHG